MPCPTTIKQTELDTGPNKKVKSGWWFILTTGKNDERRGNLIGQNDHWILANATIIDNIE